MPVFKFVGNNRGTVQRGEIEADDRGAAVALLRQRQIRVRSIKVKSAAFSFELPGLKKVSEKELVVFTRQLSTMINAGLPLVQCIDILARQSENKLFASILVQIKSGVESGATFADALRKHPNVFSDFFTNMVDAGEIGGILDTILSRLAVYMEKAAALKSRVRSAMVYPSAIVGVAILVIVFLMIFVIPVFAGLFDNFGEALPAPTQFVMNLSNFTQKYVLYITLVVGLGVYFSKRFYRTENGKRLVDSLMLKAPVVSILIMKVSVAKFTRTLGTLISSGVPIIDGLQITARTAGNKVVEDSIMTLTQAVEEGQTIAESLSRLDIFPPMVVQMIEVGESSGSLDLMLNKIADFYDDEVNNATSALLALLEPGIMVFLGGAIGFIVVAMYLPIFKVAGALNY